MSKTKTLLRNFLPEWQKSYCHFPAFQELEDRLIDFLHCEFYQFDEKRMSFLHAKENFENLCHSSKDSAELIKKQEDQIKKTSRDDYLNRLYVKSAGEKYYKIK